MSKKKLTDPLEHANHNFSAFSKIKELNEFDDWVVTTAFYSALKYMESDLFPGTYMHPVKQVEDSFETFDNYKKSHASIMRKNAHALLLDLIEEVYMENNGELVMSYQDLKDNCWNARYMDYKVDKDIVELCVEAIETIKNFVVSK